MTFDLVEYTEEELEALSVIQMQLLRNAQKKKDELRHKMEIELNMFKQVVLSNGMQASTLYEQKAAALEAEFEYQVEILKEQLLYSIRLNEPPSEGDGEADTETAGYLVDYSLPYSDRYSIVRDYYLSIPDPALRMQKYTDDEVAKRYLGKYYSTLYNVLYNYSR